MDINTVHSNNANIGVLVDNDNADETNTSDTISLSRQVSKRHHANEEDANDVYPTVDINEPHDGDEPVREWKRKKERNRNEQG